LVAWIGDPDYQSRGACCSNCPLFDGVTWTPAALIPDAPSDAQTPADSRLDAVREEFRRAGITLDDDARSVPLVRGTRRILHSGKKPTSSWRNRRVNVYEGMSRHRDFRRNPQSPSSLSPRNSSASEFAEAVITYQLFQRQWRSAIPASPGEMAG